MSEKPRAEELFDEHRARVLEWMKAGTDSFDRNLLALSSGSLALSLAFIKDVVPLGKAIWIGCLYTSWVAFALCIAVTLASFQVSVKALEKSLPDVEAYYFQNDAAAFNRYLRSPCPGQLIGVRS